jgi:hypothetical protein
MLRSGGPDERGGAAATRPDDGTAGIAPDDPDRLELDGTTAGIADRLPGIPGAGGIRPAGDARVEGMGRPVVGHIRTHGS